MINKSNQHLLDHFPCPRVWVLSSHPNPPQQFWSFGFRHHSSSTTPSDLDWKGPSSLTVSSASGDLQDGRCDIVINIHLNIFLFILVRKTKIFKRIRLKFQKLFFEKLTVNIKFDFFIFSKVHGNWKKYILVILLARSKNNFLWLILISRPKVGLLLVAWNNGLWNVENLKNVLIILAYWTPAL